MSAAPFSAVADRYGDDLAVVWVDSHPDVGTPESVYPGYHAMVLSHLLGHGDGEFLERLPATISGDRVALAGLHAWTDDDYPHIAAWGLTVFPPDTLRASSDSLVAWLRSTGCSKVAIHFDVDVVDADDLLLGLGADRGGLTLAQASRVVRDLGDAADVVALTVAEYVPRQVIRLQRALHGMPLFE